MTLYLKLISLLVIAFCIFGCNNDEEEKINVDKKIKVIKPLPESEPTEKSAVTKIKYVEVNYIQAYDSALTLWQTPFVEKDINTKFGNAHIIISGPENAEPLVLLHGMNASSTMWYPNIKALSEQHRVYAIDFLLEPGKSTYNGKISETTQLVDWYYEILDQLNIKKFSLLGASRGGWLALNIALNSPSRINKVILLSPAQTFIWIRPGPKIMNNIEYLLVPKRKRLRNVMQTMTVNVDKISQLYINQYYIATRITASNKVFMQMRPFSDKQLKSLKMPILVLIGDHDIINNNKSIEQAKKLLSDVETGKIENSGHFLSVDQPEIVNKKMLDFLNKDNYISVRK